MEQIKNLLDARQKQLEKWKKEKEKALSKAPEGSLRVCTRKNGAQYYHRTNPKDTNGVYIKERQMSLAKKLAQKDYDSKVLCAVEKELSAIRGYFKSNPKIYPEEIYEGLHIERQKIITPINETDEEYVRKWQEEVYQGKSFYDDIPEFYTQKGERVRSKSELIIADILNTKGIPYKYEHPVFVKEIGKVYPDFTVLNVRNRKEMYWEHLGMMDDPSYAEMAIKKITSYEQNGIYPGENLILTYETRKMPLSQKVVNHLIEHYL